MKRFKTCLGLLAVLGMLSAEAANREIRALFQPDPAQPSNNVFLNKTPSSGYCALYPGQCAASNMFSIQLPVRFDSTQAIEPGEGVSLKVPANWRQLTITNRETQETETVEVRIIGIGSRYILSDTAANLTGETDILRGHQNLWQGSSWVNTPPPCGYSGVGAYGGEHYRFFWKAPVEAPCTKVALFAIPSMSFDTLDFAYELRTPNPLGMSSGLYTGSIPYSLGPGADFDLGPFMLPDDANLTPRCREQARSHIDVWRRRTCIPSTKKHPAESRQAGFPLTQRVSNMIKQCAAVALTAITALTGSVSWAAREEHTFEVSVTIPTLAFYVIPAEPDWIHRPQRLNWNLSNSTLSSVRKNFDVRHDSSAIEARLEAPPFLSNGRPSDDIALRVSFNGTELSHEMSPREVLSAAEAATGKRVMLEIVPVQPEGGYRPGDYSGSVLVLFNAKAPGA